MKKKSLICLVVIFSLWSSTAAHAGPKWELGDSSWMKLGFLGQVHFAYNENGPVENDFYLRRGRVILSGQITDNIKFFMETDNPNAGKNGASSSMDIQDAFMDIRLAGSSHWVEGGLILLPFSMENFSSAASLLGNDYNSEVIKFTNHFVWRDYGIMLHGDFGKKLAYRIGVFDGYDAAGSAKNPDAELRFTGHVAYSIIGDVETGWFYTQDKLAKGNSLTIGIGHDIQNAATLKEAVEIDSKAWVVDVQSSAKVGETIYGAIDLIINGAYYDWDNASFVGNTFFVETGARVNKTMVTLKYTSQDRKNSACVEDITVGLYYYFKGHNARGGLEYRTGDQSDMVLLGIQFLL